jgi:hypothetical protein
MRVPAKINRDASGNLWLHNELSTNYNNNHFSSSHICNLGRTPGVSAALLRELPAGTGAAGHPWNLHLSMVAPYGTWGSCFRVW